MRWFVTVDWCNKGERGVFSDAHGNGFSSEQPHTEDEMAEILGMFWLILNPKSEPFTSEQLAKYHTWIPLAEYSFQYGVVLPS